MIDECIDKKKCKYLMVRVTEEQREKMKETAKKEGFRSLSAFIRWMYWKQVDDVKEQSPIRLREE